MKLDQKLIVFLIFVVIATIFWFLNALSKDYSTEISYPVRYVNFPSNKISTGKLPKSLSIKVNAYGFTLLKYVFNRNLQPVNINVGSLSLKPLPGGKKDEFYVLTSFVKDKIEEQIQKDLTILDISPDSLKFRFSTIVSKKLKVVPKIKYKLEQQFMLCDKICSDPDSVVVSGPSAILDTLKQIYTGAYNFGTVRKSLKRNLPLQKINQVRFDKKRVVLNIPVEKYTEGSVEIPVKVINAPDSVSLSLVPSAVKVLYLVGLSKYDHINADDFSLSVDYNSIDENISNKLKIHIDNFPNDVKNVKLSPKSVEYFIQKDD